MGGFGPDPAALNAAMVDGLLRAGVIHDPRVEQAFRIVQRHRFLPAVDPEVVYAGEVVVTARDPDGVARSSSSQPAVMALMLQQLAPEPGHRLLEIGTGSGYNAALLATLAAPGGLVITVEVLSEQARLARRHLTAAGVDDVEVVLGDGWEGVGNRAPYDGVIVTAAVDDLAPAWLEQVRPGGRIVAPLRIAPDLEISASFRSCPDGEWRAVGGRLCGFIPLTGAGAAEALSDPVGSDLRTHLAAGRIRADELVVRLLPHGAGRPSAPGRWLSARVAHDVVIEQR